VLQTNATDVSHEAVVRFPYLAFDYAAGRKQ
jgi:hypothetical protein